MQDAAFGLLGHFLNHAPIGLSLFLGTLDKFASQALQDFLTLGIIPGVGQQRGDQGSPAGCQWSARRPDM